MDQTIRYGISVMDFLNVRLGFATNSSSTHSVVVLKSRPEQVDSVADGIYGREGFLLETSREKRDYLAALLRDASPLDHAVIAELTGVDPDRIPDAEGGVGVIDHQSLDRFSPLVEDRSLAEAFCEVVLAEGVAIRGGDDNLELPTAVEVASVDLNPAPLVLYLAEGATALRELGYRVLESDGLVTVFHPGKGTKVRFRTHAGAPEYHPVPELVDLKITDYCPYGCEYCYQGSTTAGEHAPLERVLEVLDALAEAGVLEVAIGGGEPTLHPDFLSILEAVDARGMVPSLTTRNLTWLFSEHHRERTRRVSEIVGGIAVSIDDPAGMQALKDRASAFHERLAAEDDPAGEQEDQPSELAFELAAKIQVQLVMGTLEREAFEAIVAAGLDESGRCAMGYFPDFTLLGYKTTGRGGEVTPHPYIDWVVPAMVRAGGELMRSPVDWHPGEPFSLPMDERVSDEMLLELVSEVEAPVDNWVRSAMMDESHRKRLVMHASFGIDTTLARQLREHYGERLDAIFNRRLYYTREGVVSCYIDAVAGSLARSSYEAGSAHRPFSPARWLAEFRRIQRGEGLDTIPVIPLTGHT